MKLYKFRPLGNKDNFSRIKDILKNGFYCCDFLQFNDMNEGVFTVNASNSEITLDQKKQYNICSFSGRNGLDSDLLWGHYANAGMGVAIELEVYCDYINDIYEIKYASSAENLNNIKDILTRKSKEWSYENEFRYLSIEDNNKHKIGEITKVYFGTPYKRLGNYDAFKEKHEGLIAFLKLSENLKKECETGNIDYQYFEFDKKA